MATLYKRANAQQQLMLRIVAGAVRNAAHAHGIELQKNFARSVAKRAVGTLSAHLTDLAPTGSIVPGGLATPQGDGQKSGV